MQKAMLTTILVGVSTSTAQDTPATMPKVSGESSSSSLPLTRPLINATRSVSDSLIMERKFNAIIAMAYSKITTTLSREEFEQRITSYGCHCFTQHPKAVGGKGVPVDEIDETCRWLYRCHRCINIDFEGECDPDHIRYNYIITPSGEINCSENSNECKRSTCECDAEFARQLSATWLDQRWNNFYWTHKKNPSQKEDVQGSIMEYESSCSSSGNNVSPSDSCCGEYPNRIPYSSANKDCCNKSSKLFNSAVQSCCEDGSIRVAC